MAGLLKLEDAAKQLSVSVRTLYRWEDDHRRNPRVGPPLVRLTNGAVRVRQEDLERLVTRSVGKRRKRRVGAQGGGA